MSGNTYRHNKLRDRLVSLLLHWVESGNGGDAVAEQEYDFLGNAYGPDASFTRPSKLHLIDPNKRVQRYVPDLAVGVASESDGHNSLLRKKDRYRHAGTSEVWLITPDTLEILVYSESGNRILTSSDTPTSELLPGFSGTLADLFRNLVVGFRHYPQSLADPAVWDN